mmetsp:Transcript_30547/g.70447  ORF Transcript_30547/g.70447 Transcript_30547/m.70447 type:complete len:400 (-) Transcript_30547:1457-2656(-)
MPRLELRGESAEGPTASSMSWSDLRLPSRGSTMEPKLNSRPRGCSPPGDSATTSMRSSFTGSSAGIMSLTDRMLPSRSSLLLFSRDMGGGCPLSRSAKLFSRPRPAGAKPVPGPSTESKLLSRVNARPNSEPVALDMLSTRVIVRSMKSSPPGLRLCSSISVSSLGENSGISSRPPLTESKSPATEAEMRRGGAVASGPRASEHGGASVSTMRRDSDIRRPLRPSGEGPGEGPGDGSGEVALCQARVGLGHGLGVRAGERLASDLGVPQLEYVSMDSGSQGTFMPRPLVCSRDEEDSTSGATTKSNTYAEMSMPPPSSSPFDVAGDPGSTGTRVSWGGGPRGDNGPLVCIASSSAELRPSPAIWRDDCRLLRSSGRGLVLGDISAAEFLDLTFAADCWM